MAGSGAAVMRRNFFPAKTSMTASYLAHVHYFSTGNHVGWNQISAFEKKEFQLESQMARAPAVRLSFCAITVMAEL